MSESIQQLRLLTREIVFEEISPSRFGLVTILLISALFASFVVWAYYLQIVTSAHTEGEVVPSGAERVVQHLEGGIVSKIYVRDGDVVKQGDALISFDAAMRSAELGQVRARLTALSIKASRLRAYIDQKQPDFGEYAVSHKNLVDEAELTLHALYERIDGQKQVIKSQIEQRRKAVEIEQRKALSLQKQLQLVTEAVTMQEKLKKLGLATREKMINASVEASRVQSQYIEAVALAEKANLSIQEAKNQLTEIDVKERDKAYEELTAVMSEIAEVRENADRLDDRVKRLSIISPVSGIVHALQVHSPGAVVQPGQVMLTIIPRDEPVVVEARIDPKDIGHISIGQPTKIIIRGFDVRRYGVIEGKLQGISPSTFSNSEGRPFFKGRVILGDDAIRTGSSVHKILPGMVVEVDITTGQQSLLEYLTRPIYTTLQKSFSER